ncbi:glycosyltransferase [Haladaptatus sp. NG-WS-4]
MVQVIDVETEHALADYANDTVLRESVRRMREAVTDDVDSLDGRTVWMVNSTASGGGVAEMLPKLVGIARSLGVDAEWAVIEADDPTFFEFTKEIHNLLHGTGDPEIAAKDRDVYERISRSVADSLAELLAPEDLLVVHDPQPLAAGAMATEVVDIPAVWRCHIGSEKQTPQSRTAWKFLEPWIDHYEHTVFSLPAYVPSFLEERSTIIPPAIDPYSAKNQRLKPQQIASVLANAALVDTDHPTEPFDQQARRLQTDGTFAKATEPADIGLLFRPVVCQISRWDALKGFVPLLQGFARLKREARSEPTSRSEAHRRRIDDARLVLAGPDPSSVDDDPEGRAALEAIEEAWHDLDPAIRADVAVVVMPEDQHESALVINALQRSATIVAQNSIREGFGLTVTESMWKRAVMVGADTGGIGAQIRDGRDGRLIPDSSSPDSVARTLDEVFGSPERWDDWEHRAQRRVTDEYLVFEQVTRWLDTMGSLVR